jgi:hypothetical protein
MNVTRVERLVFEILKSKFNFYFIGVTDKIARDLATYGDTPESSNRRVAELTINFAVELDRLLSEHEK